MPLEVRVFATLRMYLPDYDPVRGYALEITPGTTIAQVVQQLGLPPEEVTLILVDGVHRDWDTPLTGRERLALFPPVGGG